MSTSDGSNGTGGGGAPGPGGGGAGGSGAGPGGGSTATTATGVAAKITHVKSTTLDAVAAANAGLTLSGLTAATAANLSGASGAAGTIVTSGGLSTVGAIKVGNSGAVATSISGTPIALNASQPGGAASIRTLGAGGPSTQVRVVMGNIMTQSMMKQLENVGPGRTQITTFPAAPARSGSNTSITVTRTATQGTYLPRASVTATQMTGVPAGQRLVTPIRTTPASVNVSGAGGTVTGIAAAGNFVRGTAVSRNTSSPATTVISQASSTTWMAANPTGQVQLIRAIPHQPRRLITTQGLSAAPAAGTVSVASVSGTVVTSTASAIQSNASNVAQQQQVAVSQQQSTIQAASSANSQPQTYVATVLPPKQHQATLVYSSNVNTSQALGAQPPFSSSGATAGPRFAVATTLTAAAGTAASPRQLRPLSFGKSFATTKFNTTSISIRAPTGVANAAGAGGTAAANSPRSNTVTGVTTATAANVIPSARFIQLQQQPGGTTQQIPNRLASNVLVQPIIVSTSGAGKIGIRPPVTMAAKVQPSLTITQLGIGKHASAAVGVQQSVNTSSTGSASPSISTANITSSSLASSGTPQFVNVSQGVSTGQLLATQNIITSTAAVAAVAAGVSATAAGGATVVPLALGSRGSGGGSIITSTMTPLKSANAAITVGKVMSQAQLASPLESSSGANSGATATPTNVFIHHAPTPQRPHSNSSTGSSGGGGGGGGGATQTSIATSVLTSSGNVPAGTFLQPGSTIYYESVPASSVQVSTGVLSLTTTTVTSSTISQSQIASSAANLSISSLPFVSHSGANTSTATYTVVPSTGGRTIGQLQIPVSSSGTQIQAMPLRFSHIAAAGSPGLSSSTTDAIAVSQAAGAQLLQAGTVENSQLIAAAAAAHGQTSVVSSLASQQHQMIIPFQTSIKVTSGGVSAPGATVVSNFLRKRDMDGSPIRAAKNLQPTLLSMGSPNPGNMPSALTVETLAKKDRAANQLSLSNSASTSSMPISRPSRADSPASSDGSTTVSANSSPGVDQQMQDGNMIINRLPSGAAGGLDTHFNPINELYSNHHSVVQQQHMMAGGTGVGGGIGTPITTRCLVSMAADHLGIMGGTVGGNMQQRLNGAPVECPPRKKSRRSTNDSQLSTQSQTSLTLPPPQISSSNNNTSNNPGVSSMALESAINASGGAANSSLAEGHEVHGKENAKPVEFILKRPKTCTLMSTYKQSWKSAYNHFQRYSDVKPREERRPTIMDLANQTNVLGKINGWKIYHLKSQMEDLCANESFGYEKLSNMLKTMELHGITNEIERVSDLVKGNMQRSKIIVDGVTEAQNQIMKIFEHKSHVSDIINRCASKRNFKKREKL